MNSRYICLLPLLLCPVYAQEAPAPATNAWEQFDNAKLAYEAISLIDDLMRDYHHTREREPEKAKLPDRETFMAGFRFALEAGEEATWKRMHTLFEQRRDFVLKQLPQADFLPAHAAQPGVEKLPDGLQYDVYTAEGSADNYRARRAHKLIARVPGSEISLCVSSTPQAIDDALYEAPRGRAWRFLLPPDMLSKTDRPHPKRLGIKAVEILAVRESMESEEIKRIQKYFDTKQPPLPAITMSTPEFDREEAILDGARAALWADADERMLTRVEALWELYVNDSEESYKKLRKEYSAAAEACWKAREELTRLQHSKLTPEILAAQEQIPGTQKLANGILYRTTQIEGQNKSLSEARFIEEEELGPESYFRVRDRVISESDLPSILRELAPQLPTATEWQIIIPPALRGKEHDLPLIYRLRLQRRQKAAEERPLIAPDIL